MPGRPGAWRSASRALHGAAEHDALFKLLRDAVGDQLGIDFGLAHFLDVDGNRARQGGQPGLSSGFSMSSPFLPITTPGRAES